MTSPTRVCFVCLGNICRSPIAEGIFRKLVGDANLDGRFVISSAGTGDWHVGHPPDARSVATARAHGVTLTGRAAHFTASDFDDHDLVIAMDRANRRDLRSLARSSTDSHKVRLLRDYDAASKPDSDVPDPYYGGDDGFTEVFELCEAGCQGLLAALTDELLARERGA